MSENIGVGSVLQVNFIQGEDYVQDAAISAAEAANSAAAAKKSENNAKDSEMAAANSAAEASDSANQASLSATQASEAQTQAQGYANVAKGYSDSAEASALSAAQAAQHASDISENVGTSVSEVENIAAGIAAQSPPTWDSNTVYSYPTVVVYSDGQTYRCIGNNVPAGTIPPASLDWVRISVLGGDDFFEVDMQGSLMPTVNPTFAYSWQLDDEGNIMPRAASDTLGTVINTYAEQTLETANIALAKANEILYEGIPVELDSDGNVTTTEEGS